MLGFRFRNRRDIWENGDGPEVRLRCGKRGEQRRPLRLALPPNQMADRVGEITGTGRVVAGTEPAFEGVRYRIVVVEQAGRRSLRKGTIEAEPSVLSTLAQLGECAIELTGLGWFGFYVTDVHRGEIALAGRINGLDSRPQLSG